MDGLVEVLEGVVVAKHTRGVGAQDVETVATFLILQSNLKTNLRLENNLHFGFAPQLVS